MGRQERRASIASGSGDLSSLGFGGQRRALFYCPAGAKQVLAPRLRRDLAAQRMRRDAAAGLAIGRRLDDPGA